MLNIPLDDVRALLESAELATLERAIASRAGLEIRRAEFATPYKRMLDLAEVSLPMAKDVLSREHDSLVRFGLFILRDREADPDGEFPPGEEPGPDDRSVQVGASALANGAGVTYLTLYLLAQADEARLLRYLKLDRAPRPKQAAARLRRFYERASGPTKG